jgi:AbiV family abortive infection protein
MVTHDKVRPPVPTSANRRVLREPLDSYFGASDERTEIVLNALRLLEDAKLLRDNERYASSFALATIALEEVGKLIINIWQSQKPLIFHKSGRITHRRKQAAASALLLAKQAEEIAREVDPNVPIDDELVSLLAEELIKTDAMRSFELVEMGAVDKTKEVALYRDDWLSATDLHADTFSSDRSMLDKTLASLRTVVSPRCMCVARILYESYLQRERDWKLPRTT